MFNLLTWIRSCWIKRRRYAYHILRISVKYLRKFIIILSSLNLVDSEDIEEAFDAYWGEQKLKAFNNLCEEEKLEKDKIQSIIEERLFSNQVVSFNEKVDNSLLVRDTFLKRKKTVKRVIEKIMNFIETFAEGLAA